MEKKDLEKRIIDVLKSCYDPEIPVDIYELGLIYEIRIEDGSRKTEDGSNNGHLSEGGTFDVEIVMTLTSPNCPVAESLPMDVENKVRAVEEVKTAKITLTFDPPWDRSMMSQEAQLELGFM